MRFKAGTMRNQATSLRRVFAGMSIASCLAVAILPIWLSASGPVADDHARAESQEQVKPRWRLNGVPACARCHSGDRKTDPMAAMDMCRLDELSTWKDRDKHKLAFQMLSSTRGKQIAGLMSGPKDATKDPRCVNCHGFFDAPGQKDTAVGGSFRVEDGVSCMICHGPEKIDSDVGWPDMHGSDTPERRLAWRKLTRPEKDERHGMRDLWDPIKRARLCASCHIGNTQEGKLVTHEMYAAGHPPLPGIEFATFSEKMPRHWEYISEKRPEIQNLYRPYDPAEPELTKFLLTSAAVAFQESMKLLATQAKLAGEAKEPETRALDWALFDCYACHHDLKNPSWRQQRGYRGKPGRPQFRPWPMVLMKISEGFPNKLGKAPTSALQRVVAEVHNSFDARPFGDPHQVAVAASKAADLAGQIADRVNTSSLKRDSTVRLLRSVCELASEELVDYDSARQLAWAFQIVYLKEARPMLKDVEIRKILDEVSKELRLELPATQARSIVDEQGVSLTNLNDYDPARAKAQFARLLELLDKQP